MLTRKQSTVGKIISSFGLFFVLDLYSVFWYKSTQRKRNWDFFTRLQKTEMEMFALDPLRTSKWLSEPQFCERYYIKPNYFEKQYFFAIIFLPKVIIEVQSGKGVLNRLVPCIWYIEPACWVLNCQFGPLLLP